jgi:hypothetical protein
MKLKLFQWRQQKSVAPTPVDSTNSALFPANDNTNPMLYGHETARADLPNILGPLNQNVAFHDSGAVYAPYPDLRGDKSFINGAGEHFFDGMNEDIEYVGRAELQRHFDEKKEIPVPSAWVPANGVEVPLQHYNYGWQQKGVQMETMYGPSVLTAPSPKLNNPISVMQTINDNHRLPLKASAPKQKRSVS